MALKIQKEAAKSLPLLIPIKALSLTKMGSIELEKKSTF